MSETERLGHIVRDLAKIPNKRLELLQFIVKQFRSTDREGNELYELLERTVDNEVRRQYRRSLSEYMNDGM